MLFQFAVLILYFEDLEIVELLDSNFRFGTRHIVLVLEGIVAFCLLFALVRNLASQKLSKTIEPQACFLLEKKQHALYLVILIYRKNIFARAND